jgi:hypothetical protein
MIQSKFLDRHASTIKIQLTKVEEIQFVGQVKVYRIKRLRPNLRERISQDLPTGFWNGLDPPIRNSLLHRKHTKDCSKRSITSKDIIFCTITSTSCTRNKFYALRQNANQILPSTRPTKYIGINQNTSPIHLTNILPNQKYLFTFKLYNRSPTKYLTHKINSTNITHAEPHGITISKMCTTTDVITIWLLNKRETSIMKRQKSKQWEDDSKPTPTNPQISWSMHNGNAKQLFNNRNIVKTIRFQYKSSKQYRNSIFDNIVSQCDQQRYRLQYKHG